MTDNKIHFSGKYLAGLIIPLVISTMLANAVGIVDTLMLSSLGEESVSGVSMVDQINVLVLNIFAALATGGAVVTSQFLGANRGDMANKSAKQLIFSGLMISTVVAVAAVLLNGTIIDLCFPSIDEKTRSAAVTYFYITALSFPFMAIDNCCAALFRSFGKSNYCMYSSFICNIVNIGGNALAIYVLDWGVAGAALSTLAGRFVSMLLLLIWISGKRSPVRIKLFERFVPDLSMIKRILHIGIPSGMENSVFQLGRLLVVGIISEYGLVQTTANAVANTLDSFGCIFGHSMNLAVITIIGQCVGAHDLDGVKRYAKKLFLIEYTFGSMFYLVTLIFIDPILSWYNLSADTAELTKLLVFIHNGVGMLIWPLAFTLPNFLRAANDVKFPMTVSIISMLVCRLLLSYVLHYTLGLGAIGVWIGMVVDWIFRLSFFCVRFFKGSWKKYCE